MNDERDREEQRGLKVNDRRRFDSAGNERSDEAPSSGDAPPSPRPRVVPPAGRAVDAEAEARARRIGRPELEGGGGGINFSSFVISLATQALMQLGEMPPPDGVAIEPDLEAARQSIEILGLIEEKTQGNLEPEEVELLREVLHSVRIAFVRRSKQ